MGIALIVFLVLQNISGSESNIKELKANWVDNKQNIEALKNYYNTIVPSQYEVSVEFKSDKLVDLEISELNDSAKHGRILWFQDWNVDLYNYKIPKPTSLDSTEYAPKTHSLRLALQKINWSIDTFIKIKKLLDKANCISITNGEPTNIGFKRSSFGEYFYNIFNETLSISDKKNYNDSCRYVYYNEHLVLEYAGGVLGAQCFPDFIKKK